MGIDKNDNVVYNRGITKLMKGTIMKNSELLNKLFAIKQEVEMYYQIAKFEGKCFKSESAKSFNAGVELAYKNVLKLISDILNEIGK